MPMLAPADVRQRVLQTIQAARRAAEARRARAAEAERDGSAVLAEVVAPACRAVAAVLKAEGYGFRVLTPAGSVRLARDAATEDFIEIALDTTRDPPALVGRVSRAWGRRVLIDEQVVREAPIGGLTEDEAIAMVLERLGPFVER